MRYTASTRSELNELAENHRLNQDPRYRADEDPFGVLDRPPTNMGTVLAWCDELFERYPDDFNERFGEVKAMPETTTLDEILKHLGADLSDYGR